MRKHSPQLMPNSKEAGFGRFRIQPPYVSASNTEKHATIDKTHPTSPPCRQRLRSLVATFQACRHQNMMLRKPTTILSLFRLPKWAMY